MMATSAAQRVAWLLLLAAAASAFGADAHAAADPHAAEGAHGEEAHGEEAHGDYAHEASHVGGHKGHAGHAPNAVGVTSAACLLGMVSAFHVLFYLVNCKYKLVRLMTWKMSSSTVSIFIAVLIWGVVLTVHERVFVPVVGFIHIPHCPMLFFTVIWSTCQLGLYIWKEDRANTATIAMLGGHVTGFCAINAFGHLQEHEYADSPAKAALCSLVFGVVVAVLAQVYVRIRHAIAMAGDGQVDETEKMWIEKCQEYEDEVVALVVGFLLAQAVRFAAVGRFVNDHEAPTEVAGAFKMMACGGILVFLTMMSIFVRSGLKKCGKLVDRLNGVVTHVLGMTSAWCIMFGMKRWIVASLTVTLDSLMMAMVVMAMVDTGLAAIVVIALQQVVANFSVNAKVLRSVISSTSLVVGLSWEKTFHHAIHSMAHSGKLGDEVTATLKLSACLVLIVMPAWKWHILPKADHRLATAEEEDGEDVHQLVDESEGEEDEEDGREKTKRQLLIQAGGENAEMLSSNSPGCSKRGCSACFGM